MLENSYFRITDQSLKQDHARFTVAILPSCPVYKGHFPGKPVCPGACNMEMLRELACHATGKELRADSVRRCRFLKVITPEQEPLLIVDMQLSPTASGYHAEAKITQGNDIVADYNAELTTL